MFILTNTEARCKQFFEPLGDSCYNFSQVQTGWTEAYFICQSIGGYLAVIETAEEQTLFENTIRNDDVKVRQGGYWVAGGDLVQEGQWQWLSNPPVALEFYGYTNWYGSEPDSQVNPENCLLVYKKWEYQWCDRFCCDPFNFICESKPVTNNNPYTF